MKILGFDVQEWTGMVSLLGTAIFLFRRYVVKPFNESIKKTVEDYIEPLTKAITDNTNSLNIAKAEHKQLGKRLDTVESQIEDHGERIKTLERDVNHE